MSIKVLLAVLALMALFSQSVSAASITVYTPSNTSYNSTRYNYNLTLNYSINESQDWTKYSVDGGENQSIYKKISVNDSYVKNLTFSSDYINLVDDYGDGNAELTTIAAFGNIDRLSGGSRPNTCGSIWQVIIPMRPFNISSFDIYVTELGSGWSSVLDSDKKVDIIVCHGPKLLDVVCAYMEINATLQADFSDVNHLGWNTIHLNETYYINHNISDIYNFAFMPPKWCDPSNNYTYIKVSADNSVVGAGSDFYHDWPSGELCTEPWNEYTNSTKACSSAIGTPTEKYFSISFYGNKDLTKTVNLKVLKNETISSISMNVTGFNSQRTADYLWNISANNSIIVNGGHITDISINSSTMYYVDTCETQLIPRIYKHNIAYRPTYLFNTSLSSPSIIPSGIATNETNIFITESNSSDDLLIAYDNGTAIVILRNITIKNINSTSIDYNGTYLFALKNNNITAYYTNGTYVGDCYINNSFNHYGISVDGDSIYVSSNGGNISRYKNKITMFADDNCSPYGETFNVSNFDDDIVAIDFLGDVFFAAQEIPNVDGDEDQIYKYRNIRGPINISINATSINKIIGNFDGEIALGISPQTITMNATRMNELRDICMEDLNGYCNIAINITTSESIAEISDVHADYNLNFTVAVGDHKINVYNNDSYSVLNETTIRFNVNATQISRCGWLSDTPTLRFVMLEEDNRTAMNGTFEATFRVLHPEDTIKLNYSFILASNETHDICLYGNNSYLADAEISYYANIFSTRNYFLNNISLNTNTSTINLYLLATALATNVGFTIRDVYQALEPDVTIKVQRYFVGTDEYFTVAMGKSGFDGTTSIPLKAGAWYKYLLEKSGSVVQTYNPALLSAATLELFTSSASVISYFSYWNSIASSCYYNNATLNVVCTVSDTSGKMVEYKLFVQEIKPMGNMIPICTDTSTSSSATLTCSVAGYENSTLKYTLVGRFCCSDPTIHQLRTDIFHLAPDLKDFGDMGLLMGMILVIVLSMIGIWNPPVAIGLGVLGIFISSTLGLITGVGGSLMSIVIVGIVMAYKVRQ